MDAIINQLNDYMAKSGASQTKVAKALGISSATLSYFLKGTYTGDIQAICDKVKDYLEVEAQRAALKTNEGLIQTKCYKTIHKFCSLVLAHQICGMLTGDAGCGKTTALKAFAKAHPSVIMIEADHGYTAKALFDELCYTLGLDDRGSLHQKLVRIVDKLNGSGRLIIIDEAEHLPYRALELIRRVHDKAGVGVASVACRALKRTCRATRPTMHSSIPASAHRAAPSFSTTWTSRHTSIAASRNTKTTASNAPRASAARTSACSRTW